MGRASTLVGNLKHTRQVAKKEGRGRKKTQEFPPPKSHTHTHTYTRQTHNDRGAEIQPKPETKLKADNKGSYPSIKGGHNEQSDSE